MAKVRKGFVSNSSSSSFICDISGAAEAGTDCCSAEDYGYVSCEHGHTMLLEYVPNYEDLTLDEDWEYELKEKDCPICQMKEIRIEDLHKFALKQLGMTDESLAIIIKSKFANLKEFEAALK